MITSQEYTALVARANDLSDAYYNGVEKASDAEFDGILEQIKEYEKCHTPAPDSPTQCVGEDNAKGFAKVLHRYPMLSLNKVLNLDELRTWVKDIVSKVGKCRFTLEYKMDGCGLAVIYKGGKLVEAVTRGNGIRGDEVTDNALRISGIPEKLNTPDDIEIRGEVIFPRSEFNRAVAAGEKLKTCRNTASGALKLRNPDAVAARNLQFYAYTIPGDPRFETQWGDIDYLKSNGFSTVEVYVGDSVEELVAICDRMSEERKGLPYDIDGMVIKVDAKDKQTLLGASATNPKFAVAYKFPNEVVYPRIKSVKFQVGKTGAITPVAIYEPMLLCGTTVQRASLHNKGIVESMGICIGDIVSVVKRGEIIPQVSGLYEKGETRTPIVFPDHCPECGAPTEYRGDKLYCTDPRCPARVAALVTSWASKKCMDIDGLSTKTIQTFHDAGLVNDPADLYNLTEADILRLEGFQIKSASSIIKAIEKSKSAGLSRVIAGLGIPNVGSTLAEELSGKFKTMRALRQATYEDLAGIETLGDGKAQAILDFMKESAAFLDKLESVEGLILGEVEAGKASDVLAGKSFCVTGTLSVSRDKIQALVKSNGGTVATSVSSKTDYLIAGVSGGSKLAKAEKLGVKIISEAEFRDMI